MLRHTFQLDLQLYVKIKIVAVLQIRQWHRILHNQTSIKSSDHEFELTTGPAIF